MGSEEPAVTPGPPQHLNDDEALLHKLGYAQELYRAMGGFGNFAISFTIISILAGCLTSYFIAFNHGGTNPTDVGVSNLHADPFINSQHIVI